MLAPPVDLLGPDAGTLLQSQILEATAGSDDRWDGIGEEDAGQPQGMTDDELHAALDEEESDAVMFGNDISEERGKLMEYYLGYPLGNEDPDRSQVISTDVLDGVEGMLPVVLRPFVSSDDVVVFSPVGKEDVEQAEQETAFVQHVFNQKLDGFGLLYRAAKEGLLQKVGVVQYYWGTRERVELERYRGLTDDQTAMTLQDDVEVVQHSSYPAPGMLPQQDPQTGQPLPLPQLHDLVVRARKKTGCPVAEVVPPEEFIICRDAREPDPKKARFCGRLVEKTISELRQEGFDVGDDISDDATDELTMRRERQARDGAATAAGDDPESSPASRKVLVRESYPLIDFDGDGIAERRRIVRVGRNILVNEEVEEVPFVAWTPYIMAHRFHGLCPADVLMDIQLQKSTLLRASFDNAYSSNNNRVAVSNKVNLDDLITNPVAGIVRVDRDELRNDIMPMPVQPIAAVTMPLMEYLDQAKESRTGFNRRNQGIDKDAINKTATGLALMMDAEGERMELLARTFAETFVKPLMIALHGLLQRHSERAEVFRLRNKWVEVNPRQWRTRYDMTVQVGLGTGNKNQMRSDMQAILTAQKEALMAGAQVTDQKRLYNALVKMTRAMGIKEVDEFWHDPWGPPDPEAPPPQPPQPPMELQIAQAQTAGLVEVEKVKAQGQAEVKSFDSELKQTEAAHKAAIDMKQVEADANVRMYQADRQAETEFAKTVLTLGAEAIAKGVEGRIAAGEADANPQQDVMTMLQPLLEMVGSQNSQVLDALRGAFDRLASIHSAPRRLVRGPDGRAVGVETVQARSAPQTQ
jgi:hypothetical protein